MGNAREGRGAERPAREIFVVVFIFVFVEDIRTKTKMKTKSRIGGRIRLDRSPGRARLRPCAGSSSPPPR